MKIVAVLAFLAACYTHTEALTCLKADDWTATGATTTTDEVCTSETTCSRPMVNANNAYELKNAAGASVWGCGECADTNKCFACSGEKCNTAAIECYYSKNLAEGAKKICQDKSTSEAETSCQRGKIALDGTYASGSFKCGEGSDTATTVNCQGTLCQELDTTKHQCFDYEQDETTDKWMKKADKKDCYTEAADGCKMPAPTNTQSSWESCGKDCTGVGDATLCSGCDDDSCNDQETAFMCYTGLANAADDAAVKAYPLQFCGAVEKCQRPYYEYGTMKTDSVGYGCGVCDEEGDPCVNCEERACNTYPNTETHKCFKWTFNTDKWEAGALKSCHTDSANRQCSMPKGDSPKSNDLVDGGCGPCATDPSDVCTPTAKEENRESTHECYTWKWETDKWTYSDDPAKCYNGDSEDKKKCSLPVDRSKNEGGFADSSVTCAACVTDAKNCLTSDPKENAGKQVIFSLTALALPIFYMML